MASKERTDRAEVEVGGVITHVLPIGRPRVDSVALGYYRVWNDLMVESLSKLLVERAPEPDGSAIRPLYRGADNIRKVYGPDDPESEIIFKWDAEEEVEATA